MTSRLVRSVLVLLVATTAMTTAAAAAPRSKPTTTVYRAPFPIAVAATGACATHINLNSTCSETATADATGDVDTAIDVHVGENVHLDMSTYAAWARGEITVPFTTSTTRSRLTVEALVHVTDAAMSFDRERYVWGSGAPLLQTTGAVYVDKDGCCGSQASGYVEMIRISTPNTSQAISGQDYLITATWQSSGGIPAGRHTATVVLGQRINAFTNGEYHSTMDATLRSITVRES